MRNRLLAIAGIATIMLFGSALGGYFWHVSHADASRNSAGTMSAVNGPYISGTAINSAQVNARLSDIESELTNSLDRNGRGGMLAATRGIDGTVAAPAYSWTSETGTGLYRIGSNDIGFAVNQVKKLELTSSLFTVTPAASFSSTLAVTGTTTSTGIFRAPDGSVTAPGVSFTSEDDGSGTGLYMGAAQSLRVAVNGAEIARFEPTRTLVGVGTSVLQINTGVTADGSGFKHKRGVAGCTTAAVAGASCSVTVTWTTAFADANYTATCNVDGSSGPVAYVGISSKVAASIQVAISAITANAATATTFECIAVHD